jgi:exopolysaccharide biosynthesis polyprenyl glycosylphosphotransferase
VAIDAGAIALAVLVAISLELVSLERPFTDGGDVQLHRALTDVVLVLAWPAVLALSRAYDRRILGLGSDEYRVVVLAAARVLSLVAVVVFVFELPIKADYVLAVIGLGTLLALVGRRLARKSLHKRRAEGRDTRRVLAVGSIAAVNELAAGLSSIAYSGLRVVGAVVPGAATDEVVTTQGTVPVVGRLDALDDAMAAVGADAVAVADSSTLDGAGVRRLAWSLEGRGIDLLVVPTVTDVVGPRIAMRPVGPIPLLFLDEPALTGPNRVVKGLFDRVVALAALVVFAPVLVVVGIAVRATTPGPALYRQERVGLDGRRFTIVKLRTMVADADARRAELEVQLGRPRLFKIEDDPRITPIGTWLRRWSLDELPQLWNVLRGDMSLVGPRPPLPDEVARYEAHVSRRLLVRPGLTGLWQVSGRSQLGWEESVRLDLHYVDNWSLALDVQILLRTVAAVLRRDGAY